MRKIAIVGAGQAGLLAAHGLLARGYRVTLYSERTPDDFLTKSRPTGAAARFDPARQWERELGLAHWDGVATPIVGADICLCPGEPNNRLLTVIGRFDKAGVAIDLRLQSHRWMLDFEARGGRLEVEEVSPERLDAIARDNELTIVAAGRGSLQALFPRDPSRSVWEKPPRRLAMVAVGGIADRRAECPFPAVKFYIAPRYGECFWLPWLHKSGERGCCILIEAKEGGRFDVFGSCRDGEETLNGVKALVRENFPWDADWIERARLLDDNSWLVGGFVPTVRRPFAELPSGRVAMALGDTLHTLDPIGGQGANNGSKMSRHLVESVVARGDLTFDAAWMSRTFETFWARERFTDAFNNILLEPMTRAGKEILIAAFGSTGLKNDLSGAQRLADVIVEGFVGPEKMVGPFRDPAAAHAMIERCTGMAWPRALALGLIRVARGQLHNKLRGAPGHPGTFALAPELLDPE